MSFPNYPEYKDSGVEWLGQIPAHWSVTKLKWFARVFSGTDFSDPDGAFDLYGANGVIGRTSIASFASPRVLIGRVGSSGAVNYSTGFYGVSDNTLVIESVKELRARFLYYWASLQDFSIDISTTAQPLLTGSQVKDRYPPFPPNSEQKWIEAFLDYETTRIDALIEEQQRLIELLKEKRQAVISHAVTKGPDPDVPMKDSGVEWLGEVPAHWGVGRVKNVTSFITSGPRGWSDFLDEDGTGIFLQSGDLDDGLGVNFSDANRITVPAGAEGIRTRVQESDVVVCITGANTGRVAVIKNISEVAYVNQHLALVRPEHELCREMFLGFALSCNVCQSYFRVEQYGLKEGLSLTDVAEAPLAFPPLEEQAYIVQRVADTLNGLDGLASNAAKMVELLRERRNALISSAVTGKIDVRAWQPPASGRKSPHRSTSVRPA